MAGEIRQYDVNGSTWYAVIVRASDGYWLNGSTFEDPVVANWTSYARALTQKSTTGAYYGDFPSIAAGLYDVVIYRQAGGSPAASDGPPAAVPVIDWKGSAEAAYSDIPTAAQIADKVLGRNIAGSSDGGRTVTEALRVLRNRWTRTADTLTVYAEDDSTTSWTSTLTTSDTLDPVSESNP